MVKLSRVVVEDLLTMLVVARADVLAPSLCWWLVLHAAVVQCIK